jgi:hypothetical protein
MLVLSHPGPGIQYMEVALGLVQGQAPEFFANMPKTDNQGFGERIKEGPEPRPFVQKLS